MRNTSLSRVIAGNASEAELLEACREGHSGAVEQLVDLHVNAAVTASRRLAPLHIENGELLDRVHDALVTAFDEAIEGDADSMTFVFLAMMRAFLDGAPVDSDDYTQRVGEVVTPQDMRQLRSDLVQEFRVMVTIRAESPKSRTPAQRLLLEIRSLRRRMQLRTGTLRARWTTVVVTARQ